jgi:hypothetical protein
MILKGYKILSIIYKMTKIISTYSDFTKMREHSYTIPEIKEIYNKFKIKWKKKLKKDAVEECYLFLKHNYYAVKLQKFFLRQFIQSFNKTQGPARLNRRLCNNVEDFLTTETMNEIDYYYFFSYLDTDGFVYGFNIISIYNLILKKDTKNPYTRNDFSMELIELVIKRIEYNRVLKKVHHDIIPIVLTPNNKLISLFQKIDQLGNYTQVEWLINLTPFYMRRFILELYDIWDYRSQLTKEMKINICPPFGTPFREIPTHIIQNNMNLPIETLKNFCATIIHQFINSSSVRENQVLGSIYVLSALTLVNPIAAESMPWLYYSVL